MFDRHARDSTVDLKGICHRGKPRVLTWAKLVKSALDVRLCLACFIKSSRNAKPEKDGRVKESNRDEQIGD